MDTQIRKKTPKFQNPAVLLSLSSDVSQLKAALFTRIFYPTMSLLGQIELTLSTSYPDPSLTEIEDDED